MNKTERGNFIISMSFFTIVADVVEGSPAEKAGFKRGDLITGYDGKHVDDSTALRNMVAGTLPDKTLIS